MSNLIRCLALLVTLSACNSEEASKGTATASGGSAAVAATALVVYPEDSAYTEGDTGHAYTINSGANQNAVMGDYNARWRTTLLRFNIATLSNTASARLYIYRDNSNDAPAIGFDPFGAMAYLHAEKLRTDPLVPGMGRADIWFWGADYSVPVPIGNLANDNTPYMTNNAALSVDITDDLNDSITAHDTYINVRIRHTGNTASGNHRVDFHLKHAQAHNYKPYLEVAK